jgi:hypothetical protein
MGTPSARRSRPALGRTGSPNYGTLRYRPQHLIEVAPPRAPGTAACPHGSPPGAAVSPPSPVPRTGTPACGAGPAPSDLECRPDPRQGWPGGAIAPYDATPAASLPAAPPPHTAGALSACEAPRRRGAGRGAPPHCGEAVAWPGTLGLGTPDRRPAADQPSDGQAEETRHAAGTDPTDAVPQVALLRTPPSP